MDENVLEQLIGCWQSEGWDFIFGEQVELIPFVSETLTDIGAADMLAVFEKVIACFPEGTVFENTAKYYDLYNFMHIYSYKVQDEKLKTVPTEQRRALVKHFRGAIDELDTITAKHWNNTDMLG